MTKLRNATLALAASLLATGALGQAFKQESETVTVAEELFGDGVVELQLGEDDAFMPKAKLIFTGTEIAGGTEFDVTYTLVNATFARRVDNYDVMWGVYGPEMTLGGPDCDTTTADGVNTETGFCEKEMEASITVKEGGETGSSSVTYTFVIAGTAKIANLKVPIKENNATDYTGETRMIQFVLPELNASGLVDGKKEVWVYSSVTQETRGGGTGTAFDRELADKHMCGTYDPGVTTTVGCPLVTVHKVLTELKLTAGGGEISLAPADMRTVLVSGSGKALDPQRVKIATVSVTSNFGSTVPGEETKDAEGNVLKDFSGGALRGNLTVSVSSDGLRDGDVVYSDANANKAVDGTEAFDRGAGTATDTLALNGTYAVYYVPNGEDALKHRTKFTIGATTEFTLPGNKNASATPATATLTLHGIMDDSVKAYAIAPLTSTDVTNVRVKCESGLAAGCNVFLECTDGMGMSTFGEGGAMIAAGASVRWDQEDIAEALGFGMMEGWEGRLSCEVLSTADISVQVLTRAAGVLVNNTYVSSTEK